MKRLWTWGPVLGWMGLIFWLSSQPDIPTLAVGWLDQLVKSGGHAALYAVLALLLERAWRLERWSVRARRPAVMLVVLLYALSDEWHQSFVPGRFPSLYDVFFDLLGAFLALWFAPFFRASLPERSWLTRLIGTTND